MKFLFSYPIQLLALTCFLCFANEPRAAAESQPTQNQNKEEVVIGVIAPLTMGNAERGQEIVNTLSLLGERYSAASSKYRYRFIFEDGKCGVGSAPTTAAEKLIHVDKVRFLITGCSGETLQAGPIAQRSSVLTMAVFSAHQDVKKLGDFIFRTCPDQERAADLFAKEIACEKLEKIALLSEENAFTQGMKTLLLARIQQRVNATEDFPVETTDFRTLLVKLKSANPEAFYFNAASPASLAALVRQTKDLGFTIPIFGYLHPDDPSFFKAAGAAAVGIRYLGVPDAKDVSPSYEEFMTAFKARFGPAHIETIVRTTHDGLQSIADGIEKVGSNPAAVRDFLGSYRANGATGLLAYDQNGDITNLNYVLKKVGPDGIGTTVPPCLP